MTSTLSLDQRRVRRRRQAAPLPCLSPHHGAVVVALPRYPAAIGARGLAPPSSFSHAAATAQTHAALNLPTSTTHRPIPYPAAPSRDRTLTEDSRDDLAKPKQRSAPPKKKGGRGGGLERKGSTKSGSSSSDVSSRDSSVESNTDRRECGGAVVGPSVLGAQLTPYYVWACLACTAPLTPSPHLPSPLSTLRRPPSSLLPPSPPSPRRRAEQVVEGWRLRGRA